jgi:hypothetical protein
MPLADCTRGRGGWESRLHRGVAHSQLDALGRITCQHRLHEATSLVGASVAVIGT